MRATEARARVHSGVALLRSGYEVAWAEGRSSGQHWPDYDARLYGAFDGAAALIGVDHEYPSRIEAARSRPVAEADASDLATRLTWIRRGERFSDGFIAGFVADGTLCALFERVLEVTSVPPTTA